MPQFYLARTLGPVRASARRFAVAKACLVHRVAKLGAERLRAVGEAIRFALALG